jgi:hypothetical protein
MDEASDIAETAPPSTAPLSVAVITLASLLAEFEAKPFDISDNFPRTPAISGPELDAIERYMGDILDEVLDCRSGAMKHANKE